ncbi:MAG: lysine exporter LysO family protein [Sphaerochaetaceae bacterium]
MQTAFYLLRLFLALILGSLFARVTKKISLKKVTRVALDLVLYMLLFFMGVNSSKIPDIGKRIVSMGGEALVATLFVIAGCIFSSYLLSLLIRNRVNRVERVRQRISLERLKTPFIMIGLVACGLLGGIFTPLFNWFDDSYITLILYGLLFLVGMEMVQNEINLLPLLKSPLMLLLPLSTLFGTYLGALFIPLVTPYSLRESMALVSGFGWYSLSGVMISSLGNPHLGTVSFLSNLFRETFSFILIPLLATLSQVSFSAVSIGGATSMDVTLPLLKRSLGDSVVPLAIGHGVVMTLLAPLLIPLWFG